MKFLCKYTYSTYKEKTLVGIHNKQLMLLIYPIPLISTNNPVLLPTTLEAVGSKICGGDSEIKYSYGDDSKVTFTDNYVILDTHLPYDIGTDTVTITQGLNKRDKTDFIELVLPIKVTDVITYGKKILLLGKLHEQFKH